MGMHDYIDNITAYCPQCGKKLTENFQTKDFKDPFLNHYKPGDTVPEDRETYSYIDTYSICQNCRLLVNIGLVVEDNVLTDKFC